MILDINSETSEEHKLGIHKSSYKLILNFVIIEKTSIVNKLKQSEDLQHLAAQFMMDTESIGNHVLTVFQILLK